MTVFFHELRRGRISLIIWAGAIAAMLAVSVMVYPEMASEMEQASDMFANMGEFTAAFGMDKVNFGEFMGYFGIECGNTMGLGGAFFASLLGIAALAKEEKEHTAEFLLTHSVSRTRIVVEKLCAVAVQTVILNAVIVCASMLAMTAIGETADAATMARVFFACFLMQIELAAVTFGISAFLRRGGLGVGIGLAAIMYMLNIISNLTDSAEFLKYITPFGYCDSAEIISNNALNLKYIAVGAAIAAASVAAGFVKYRKKDIA